LLLTFLFAFQNEFITLENEIKFNSSTKPMKTTETLLEAAARLITEEHDNLVDSAPRGLLIRLEEIAAELEAIENQL
jgi:hypothetical protein